MLRLKPSVRVPKEKPLLWRRQLQNIARSNAPEAVSIGNPTNQIPNLVQTISSAFFLKCSTNRFVLATQENGWASSIQFWQPMNLHRIRPLPGNIVYSSGQNKWWTVDKRNDSRGKIVTTMTRLRIHKFNSVYTRRLIINRTTCQHHGYLDFVKVERV